MLPAMNPELQKIAKPTRTITVRPRRPIFGILDGVGRPTERGMFNSLNVAAQLGTEQVSRVLGRMQNLEPIVIPRFFFLAYWNPSIKERIRELNIPRSVGLPTPSRIPKIGLRGRTVIVLVGFAIFWSSGFIAGNIYARGQTTVACADNTCAALVVIAAVGFWMAIIGGISILVWTVRRFL